MSDLRDGWETTGTSGDSDSSGASSSQATIVARRHPAWQMPHYMGVIVAEYLPFDTLNCFGVVCRGTAQIAERELQRRQLFAVDPLAFRLQAVQEVPFCIQLLFMGFLSHLRDTVATNQASSAAGYQRPPVAVPGMSWEESHDVDRVRVRWPLSHRLASGVNIRFDRWLAQEEFQSSNGKYGGCVGVAMSEHTQVVLRPGNQHELPPRTIDDTAATTAAGGALGNNGPAMVTILTACTSDSENSGAAGQTSSAASSATSLIMITGPAVVLSYAGYVSTGAGVTFVRITLTAFPSLGDLIRDVSWQLCPGNDGVVMLDDSSAQADYLVASTPKLWSSLVTVDEEKASTAPPISGELASAVRLQEPSRSRVVPMAAVVPFDSSAFLSRGITPSGGGLGKAAAVVTSAMPNAAANGSLDVSRPTSSTTPQEHLLAAHDDSRIGTTTDSEANTPRTIVGNDRCCMKESADATPWRHIVVVSSNSHHPLSVNAANERLEVESFSPTAAAEKGDTPLLPPQLVGGFGSTRTSLRLLVDFITCHAQNTWAKSQQTSVCEAVTRHVQRFFFYPMDRLLRERTQEMCLYRARDLQSVLTTPKGLWTVSTGFAELIKIDHMQQWTERKELFCAMVHRQWERGLRDLWTIGLVPIYYLWLAAQGSSNRSRVTRLRTGLVDGGNV